MEEVGGLPEFVVKIRPINTLGFCSQAGKLHEAEIRIPYEVT